MDFDLFPDNQRNAISYLCRALNILPSSISFEDDKYLVDLGHNTFTSHIYLIEALTSAYRTIKGKLSLKEEVFIEKCHLLWVRKVASTPEKCDNLREHCWLLGNCTDDNARLRWLITHAAYVEILLEDNAGWQ